MPRSQADWRSLSGIAAGPLFILVFLVAGALTPGYSVARHPVSTLVLGEYGWAQVLSFLITGALVIAFATVFWRERRSLALFLVMAGIGLIGAGIFRTDAVAGFPPKSATVVTPSVFGLLHELFSMLFFLGVPLAAATVPLRCLRIRRRSDAIYSIVSASLFLVFFVLAGIGFDGTTPGFDAWGGLMQRICIATGLGWITVLALSIRREGLAALDP